MRLPNAEDAQVDFEKLKGYLLSETHPIGKSKAKFFRGVGFDESNAALLERGLFELAQSNEIVDTLFSLHGAKYIIDPSTQAPALAGGHCSGFRPAGKVTRGPRACPWGSTARL